MALMFLNGDGMRGGRAHYTIEGVPLVGERRTAPLYRFFSVRDEFPALYPVAEGGQPILGELYDVPMGPLSALLATEPPELELSIIELEDGELSFAMVLREAEHALGIHKDITSYGGWRAYRAAALSEGPDKRRPRSDAPDPHPGHVRRGGQGEDPGQRVGGVAGVTQVDRQRAPVGRAQPDRVEVLADREVADPVLQAERPGAGPGRQVQQVGRRQAQPGRAEQLLDEVGLQRLLGQEQAGARAHVGAERDTDPVLARAGAAGKARCPGRCCWSGSARPTRRARPARRARRRRGGRCARTRCAR